MTILGFQDALGETERTVDVVIVGSGPGGSAAARVIARGGRSVLVLEEGPAQHRFRPAMSHTMRYHMQEGGSMVALGHAPVSVAAGRGIGGGSLINSAICWRAPSEILDGWTDVIGEDTFSAAQMAPAYDDVGARIGVTRTSEAIAGENNLLIVRGAKKLGLEADLLHRNAPQCVGCGVCNYGCPSGGKWSVDRTLLVDARDAGAVVQADVKVDAVLVAQGRAAGVRAEVRDPDTGAPVGRLTVHAKQVVVAAGAVGTPRLLHHAGLADVLGPRLGQGLHLHPGNAVMALCDHEVKMWTGATQGAYFADPELPGVLPHTLSLPPGALLLALGGAGAVVKENIALASRFTGCVVMVSDKGEGTVGADANGFAKMTYAFAPVDIDNMRKGMKRTCEVLLAGGASRLFLPIHNAGFVDGLDEAFRIIDAADLRDYQALYAAHPMATCRIGKDAQTSVCGPTGEAHGLPGLFIADASVFPTSLGVNPQWTTMAMATIIAGHVLAAA